MGFTIEGVVNIDADISKFSSKMDDIEAKYTQAKEKVESEKISTSPLADDRTKGDVESSYSYMFDSFSQAKTILESLQNVSTSLPQNIQRAVSSLVGGIDQSLTTLTGSVTTAGKKMKTSFNDIGFNNNIRFASESVQSYTKDLQSAIESAQALSKRSRAIVDQNVGQIAAVVSPAISRMSIHDKASMSDAQIVEQMMTGRDYSHIPALLHSIGLNDDRQMREALNFAVKTSTSRIFRRDAATGYRYAGMKDSGDPILVSDMVQGAYKDALFTGGRYIDEKVTPTPKTNGASDKEKARAYYQAIRKEIMRGNSVAYNAARDAGLIEQSNGEYSFAREGDVLSNPAMLNQFAGLVTREAHHALQGQPQHRRRLDDPNNQSALLGKDSTRIREARYLMNLDQRPDAAPYVVEDYQIPEGIGYRTGKRMAVPELKIPETINIPRMTVRQTGQGAQLMVPRRNKDNNLIYEPDLNFQWQKQGVQETLEDEWVTMGRNPVIDRLERLSKRTDLKPELREAIAGFKFEDRTFGRGYDKNNEAVTGAPLIVDVPLDYFYDKNKYGEMQFRTKENGDRESYFSGDNETLINEMYKGNIRPVLSYGGKNLDYRVFAGKTTGGGSLKLMLNSAYEALEQEDAARGLPSMLNFFNELGPNGILINPKTGKEFENTEAANAAYAKWFDARNKILSHSVPIESLGGKTPTAALVNLDAAYSAMNMPKSHRFDGGGFIDPDVYTQDFQARMGPAKFLAQRFDWKQWFKDTGYAYQGGEYEGDKDYHFFMPGMATSADDYKKYRAALQSGLGLGATSFTMDGKKVDFGGQTFKDWRDQRFVDVMSDDYKAVLFDTTLKSTAKLSSVTPEQYQRIVAATSGKEGTSFTADQMMQVKNGMVPLSTKQQTELFGMMADPEYGFGLRLMKDTENYAGKKDFWSPAYMSAVMMTPALMRQSQENYEKAFQELSTPEGIIKRMFSGNDIDSLRVQRDPSLIYRDKFIQQSVQAEINDLEDKQMRGYAYMPGSAQMLLATANPTFLAAIGKDMTGKELSGIAAELAVGEHGVIAPTVSQEGTINWTRSPYAPGASFFASPYARTAANRYRLSQNSAMFNVEDFYTLNTGDFDGDFVWAYQTLKNDEDFKQRTEERNRRVQELAAKREAEEERIKAQDEAINGKQDRTVEHDVTGFGTATLRTNNTLGPIGLGYKEGQAWRQIEATPEELAQIDDYANKTYANGIDMVKHTDVKVAQALGIAREAMSTRQPIERMTDALLSEKETGSFGATDIFKYGLPTYIDPIGTSILSGAAAGRRANVNYGERIKTAIRDNIEHRYAGAYQEERDLADWYGGLLGGKLSGEFQISSLQDLSEGRTRLAALGNRIKAITDNNPQAEELKDMNDLYRHAENALKLEETLGYNEGNLESIKRYNAAMHWDNPVAKYGFKTKSEQDAATILYEREQAARIAEAEQSRKAEIAQAISAQTGKSISSVDEGYLADRLMAAHMFTGFNWSNAKNWMDGTLRANGATFSGLRREEGPTTTVDVDYNAAVEEENRLRYTHGKGMSRKEQVARQILTGESFTDADAIVGLAAHAYMDAYGSARALSGRNSQGDIKTSAKEAADTAYKAFEEELLGKNGVLTDEQKKARQDAGGISFSKDAEGLITASYGLPEDQLSKVQKDTLTRINNKLALASRTTWANQTSSLDDVASKFYEEAFTNAAGEHMIMTEGTPFELGTDGKLQQVASRRREGHNGIWMKPTRDGKEVIDFERYSKDAAGHTVVSNAGMYFTPDMIKKDDNGNITIVDWKSSQHGQKDALFQMGFYAHQLEQLGRQYHETGDENLKWFGQFVDKDTGRSRVTGLQAVNMFGKNGQQVLSYNYTQEWGDQVSKAVEGGMQNLAEDAKKGFYAQIKDNIGVRIGDRQVGGSRPTVAPEIKEEDAHFSNLEEAGLIGRLLNPLRMNEEVAAGRTGIRDGDGHYIDQDKSFLVAKYMKDKEELDEINAFANKQNRYLNNRSFEQLDPFTRNIDALRSKFGEQDYATIQKYMQNPLQYAPDLELMSKDFDQTQHEALQTTMRLMGLRRQYVDQLDESMGLDYNKILYGEGDELSKLRSGTAKYQKDLSALEAVRAEERLYNVKTGRFKTREELDAEIEARRENESEDQYTARVEKSRRDNEKLAEESERLQTRYDTQEKSIKEAFGTFEGGWIENFKKSAEYLNSGLGSLFKDGSIDAAITGLQTRARDYTREADTKLPDETYLHGTDERAAIASLVTRLQERSQEFESLKGSPLEALLGFGKEYNMARINAAMTGTQISREDTKKKAMFDFANAFVQANPNATAQQLMESVGVYGYNYDRQFANQEAFRNLHQQNQLAAINDQSIARVSQMERQFENANRQQAMRFSNSRLLNAVYSVQQRKDSAEAQYENYSRQIEAEKRTQSELRQKMFVSSPDSKEYKEAASAYEQSQARLNGLTAAAGEAKNQLDQLNSVGTMGKAVFGAFGQSINMLMQRFGRQLFQKALTEAKKFVQEFDKSMTSIQMITLKSDEQMSTLGDSLIAKAKELKISVSEITQSAETLYRQGLSDQEVNDRLDVISKFSKVSGTKVDAATKLITVAMNTGLVSDPQIAADIVTALGDNAATNAAEIEKGIEKAGAAAAADGTTFAELASMLTAITSTTQIGGNVAGRTLNTIFGRMNKIGTNELIYDENGHAISGSAVAKLLQNQGISQYDINGNKRSSYAVLSDLSKKWETMSDAEQQQIATAIAGTRMYSNFAAIMQGMSEGKVDEYMSLAGASTGIVDEKYQIYTQSLQASLTDVKNTFDELVHSLTDSGALSGFLKNITGMIEGVEGLTSSLGGLGGVLASIIPMFIALTTFKMGLGTGNIGLILGGLGIGAATAVGLKYFGQNKTEQPEEGTINGVSYEDYAKESIAVRNKSTGNVDALINDSRVLLNNNNRTEEEERRLTLNLQSLVTQFGSLGYSVDDLTGSSEKAAKALDEISQINNDNKRKNVQQERQEIEEAISQKGGSMISGPVGTVDYYSKAIMGYDAGAPETSRGFLYEYLQDPSTIANYLYALSSEGNKSFDVLDFGVDLLNEIDNKGRKNKYLWELRAGYTTAGRQGGLKGSIGQASTEDFSEVTDLIKYFITSGQYSDNPILSQMLVDIVNGTGSMSFDDLLAGKTAGYFSQEYSDAFFNKTASLFKDVFSGNGSAGIVSDNRAQIKEERAADVKTYSGMIYDMLLGADNAPSPEKARAFATDFENMVLTEGYESLSDVEFWPRLLQAYQQFCDRVIGDDNIVNDVEPFSEIVEEGTTEEDNDTYTYKGIKHLTKAEADAMYQADVDAAKSKALGDTEWMQQNAHQLTDVQIKEQYIITEENGRITVGGTTYGIPHKTNDEVAEAVNADILGGAGIYVPSPRYEQHDEFKIGNTTYGSGFRGLITAENARDATMQGLAAPYRLNPEFMSQYGRPMADWELSSIYVEPTVTRPNTYDAGSGWDFNGQGYVGLNALGKANEAQRAYIASEAEKLRSDDEFMAAYGRPMAAWEIASIYNVSEQAAKVLQNDKDWMRKNGYWASNEELLEAAGINIPEVTPTENATASEWFALEVPEKYTAEGWMFNGNWYQDRKDAESAEEAYVQSLRRNREFMAEHGRPLADWEIANIYGVDEANVDDLKFDDDWMAAHGYWAEDWELLNAAGFGPGEYGYDKNHEFYSLNGQDGLTRQEANDRYNKYVAARVQELKQNPEWMAQNGYWASDEEILAAAGIEIPEVIHDTSEGWSYTGTSGVKRTNLTQEAADNFRRLDIEEAVEQLKNDPEWMAKHGFVISDEELTEKVTADMYMPVKESKFVNAIEGAQYTSKSDTAKLTGDEVYQEIIGLGIDSFKSLQEKVDSGEVGHWEELMTSYPALAEKMKEFITVNEDGSFTIKNNESPAQWAAFMEALAGVTMDYTTTNAQTREEQVANARTAFAKYQKGQKITDVSSITGNAELKKIIGDKLYGDWLTGELSTEEQNYIDTLLTNYQYGLSDFTAGQRLSGIKEVRKNIGRLGVGYDREIADKYMSQWSGWNEYASLKERQANGEILSDKELKRVKDLELSLDNFQRSAEIKFEIEGIQQLEEAGEIASGVSAEIEKLQKGGKVALEVTLKYQTEGFEAGQQSAKLYNGTASQQEEAAMAILGMSKEQFYSDRTGNIERAKAVEQSNRQYWANTWQTRYDNATTPEQKQSILEAANLAGYGWVEDYSDYKLPAGYTVDEYGTVWIDQYNASQEETAKREAAMRYIMGYVGAPEVTNANPFAGAKRSYTDAELASARMRMLNGETMDTIGTELYEAAASGMGMYGAEYMRQVEAGETPTERLKQMALFEANQTMATQGQSYRTSAIEYEKAALAAQDVTNETNRATLASYLNIDEDRVIELANTKTQNDTSNALADKLAEQRNNLVRSIATGLEAEFTDLNSEVEGLQGLDLGDVTDLDSLVQALRDAAANADEQVAARLNAYADALEGATSAAAQDFNEAFLAASGKLNENTYERQGLAFIKANSAQAAKTAQENGITMTEALSQMEGWDNNWNNAVFGNSNTTAALGLFNAGKINADQLNSYLDVQMSGETKGQEYYASLGNILFGDKVNSEGMFNIPQSAKDLQELQGVIEEIQNDANLSVLFDEWAGSIDGFGDVISKLKDGDIKGAQQALEDFNNQMNEKRASEATKYTKAAANTATALSKIKKGGKDASEGMTMLRKDFKDFQDQTTAIQNAQGKSGSQLSQTTREIIADMFENVSADDIKQMTADELSSLLEGAQSAIDESFSDTLQSAVDMANPQIDLSNVDLGVNGEISLDQLVAACDSASAEVLAQIAAMAGEYGSVHFKVVEDGDTVKVVAEVQTSGKRGGGYNRGSSGGGGGKSAAEQLIDEWKHKVTAQQHEVTMAGIQAQDAAQINDGRGYIEAIDKQIEENEKLRKVYEEELEALKAQLATVSEGSDDWWALKEAIQSAEEAQAQLNKTIADLETAKINEIVEAYEYLSSLATHESTVASSKGKRSQQLLNYDAWQESIDERVSARRAQTSAAQDSLQQIQQQYDAYLAGGGSADDDTAREYIKQMNALKEVIASEASDIQDILNEQLDIARTQRDTELIIPDYYSSMLDSIIDKLDSENDAKGQLAALEAKKSVAQQKIEVYRGSNDVLAQQLQEEFDKNGYSQQYYEILKEMYGNLEAIAQLEQEIRDATAARLDVITEFFDNKLNQNTHDATMLDMQQSLLDFYNDYGGRSENVAAQRENLSERKTQLQQKLNALAAEQSNYEEGDANWIRARDEMNKIIEELYGIQLEETELDTAQFTAAKENFDNMMKPFTHADNMYSIDAERFGRLNDYENQNAVIDYQLVNNKNKQDVYKKTIDEMKKLREGVAEGSDAWWNYTNAINEAEEALGKLDNEAAKLRAQKLTNLLEQQQNEDKAGNHQYDMLGMIASRALLQEDYETYYQAQIDKQYSIKDTIDQNKQQVSELEELLATFEIGSDEWLKTRDEIWKIKKETAQKENEAIQIEQEIARQRLAQITQELNRNTKYDQHRNTMMQSYGALFQRYGNYQGYRNTIDIQLEDWQGIKADTEIARAQVLEQMEGLEIGSKEWYEARDAVYAYDEALLRADVEMENLTKAKNMSYLQEVADEFSRITQQYSYSLAVVRAAKNKASSRDTYEDYKKYAEQEKTILTQQIQSRNAYVEEQKRLMAGFIKDTEEWKQAKQNIINALMQNVSDQSAIDQIDLDAAKSWIDKVFEKMDWADSETEHKLNIVQYQETLYQNRGELTNYGKTLEIENDIRQKAIDRRKEEIKQLKAEQEQLKDNATEYNRITEKIKAKEEAIESDTVAIEENTKKLKENEIAIRNTRKTLEDMVEDELKKDKERRKKMLDSEVNLQKVILDTIKARYKDQWDLEKKDIDKQKKALQDYKKLLNERLNARKAAMDTEEKYRQLEEYQSQLTLISADPTRTKDAKTLREQIRALQRDLAMDSASKQVEAESEAIDQAIESLDDYVTVHGEDLEALLADSRNFADEVNLILSGSFDSIVAWLAENNTEFKNSLDEAQQQMKENWEQTWKDMLGIVDTYWPQIDEILSSYDNFVSFMMQTPDFLNASANGQALILLDLAQKYEDFSKAAIASLDNLDAKLADHEQKINKPSEDEEQDLDLSWLDEIGQDKPIIATDATVPEVQTYSGVGQEVGVHIVTPGKIETEDTYDQVGIEQTHEDYKPTYAEDSTPDTPAAPEAVYQMPGPDDTGFGDFEFPTAEDIQHQLDQIEDPHIGTGVTQLIGITWMNGNTVLSSDTVKKGDTPKYSGATPTKAEDSSNTYTFSGWSPTPGPVESDTTYVAQFNATAKPQPEQPSQPTTQTQSSDKKWHFSTTWYKGSGASGVATGSGATKEAAKSAAYASVPPNTHYTVDGSYSYYKRGGIVDYTGPAWVDGSPTEPEAFLSAYDTKAIQALTEALRQMYVPTSITPSSTNFAGNTNYGDIYITINQAELKDDADFEQVARRVGQAFTKEMTKQGFNMNGYSF